MIKHRIVVRSFLEDGRDRVDPERSVSCCSCFNNTQCFVPFQKGYLRQGASIDEKNPEFNPGRPLFLDFEASTLLWCSALGYLLPVLALCIGAVFGESIDRGLNFENSELFSIIFGLSGFALSFQIKRWIIAHYPHRYRIRPALFSEL